MKPENGINLNKFDYFPLEEYVRRIKIEDHVLEHMEETNKEFDTYLSTLTRCDINKVQSKEMKKKSKKLKYLNSNLLK